MKELKIDEFKVGQDHPTFIIAEIGLNHNGEVGIAKDMIKKAKECGADAVKFQMFNAEELCSKESDYFDTFDTLQLSEEEWHEIKEFAEEEDILFTSSVFDKESTDLLDKLGSPMFKIASGDITHIPLLNHISKKQKPVVMSTGMSNISEVEEAVETFYSNGNEKVSLLHCVSNYPASLDNLNLSVINTLKNAFDIPVGFSDHTLDIIAPVTAVSLGADIIEKHFTLDRDMDGPDHELSLPPDMFSEMVDKIREIEKGIGNGVKRPMEDEETIKNIRRSLTTRRIIEKGEEIKEEAVKITRPENGIKPKFYSKVIGRKTKNQIQEDEPIKWDYI